MILSTSTTLLPLTLLDLTLARLPTRFNGSMHKNSLSFGMFTRTMQQAALATSPSMHKYSGQQDAGNRSFTRGRRHPKRTGVMAVRTGERPGRPPTQLERRVQELQESVVSEESILDLPAFSEEELLSLYEDLLALPPSTGVVPRDSPSQLEEDLSIINAVDQRLLETQPTSVETEGLSKNLRGLRQKTQTSSQADAIPERRTSGDINTFIASSQPYRRVLWRVQDLMMRMENIQLSLLPGGNVDNIADQETSKKIAISILSVQEWESLTRICIQAQDAEAAEISLDLMKRSGIPPPEESFNQVLSSYANNGDVEKADTFMMRSLTGPPTDRQRHLHIKAHLNATPPNTMPYSALSVLHTYETRNLPAPMPTYTRVITSLFSVHSSLAHAQAWDLFTHMRYVSHPTPDSLLYTLMIRACASSPTSPSEPERALDLWTEMTIEKRIEPTAGAYGAIILACARSGVKGYVNEAFRLAKEMLDAHRDARGESAFRPDRKTFCALLEGAKRVGDLGRVRWILAEMVRGHRGGLDEGVADAEVNEEAMMHVFHAYAAYRPPFKRTFAVLANEEGGSAAPPTSSIPTEEESLLTSEAREGLPVEDAEPTFSHIPPQSRSEVVGEAKALFNRILRDLGMERLHDSHQTDGDSVSAAPKLFRNVQLTPRLVNSYLSVHYAHSSLSVAYDLFKTLFADVDVRRNTRSYMEALERCGISRRGKERAVALAFAEELWAEWQTLEDSRQDGEHNGRGVDARSVERAHVAMIRVLTLTGNVDRAVDQVKTFCQRYPPADIREPAPKPALRSTRTALVGTRPLVRMTSTVEVPDDTVPPLLTFTDVEILHHRLVAAGKLEKIRFLTYICKAYEGALRMRRDGALKAEPAKEDGSLTLTGTP